MGTKDEMIKAEVLAQAQKLFRHYGLTKTTMEDIAKAAGKGKSTLYYYYKSKEEIYKEVVMGEMNETFSFLKEAVEAAETAEDKLRAYSLTKFRVLQEKVNLYTVICGDIESNFQLMMELHKNYESQELQLVKAILDLGQERGEFPGIINANTDQLAFTMVCAGRGLQMGLVFNNNFVDLDSRIDLMSRILMYGLKGENPAQK
ncbi:TetR/AcrR family transcriptional regulator [Rufibacter glacialis]|uniref:TetR/AcrR family transcriptional regulator n=1 Tax=Rufibacter glacialis TaxID=1259555 RepID=A0A5M8QFJ5_9BACT|nr:TetR/AcrR family transcriptional regulator [Rufibacter glacialis]KAA6434805.1 TetR/AcrR family transcriptional regulator [Rufibacter glacialis]GGK72578.1 hypothetical protein GCM10011405_21030 [Rufibacter glacialis]